MHQPSPQYPGFVVPVPTNLGYPNIPPPMNPSYPHMPSSGTPNINVIHITNYGPEPQQLQCPHCHTYITTIVKPTASFKTHIIALLCCLFGCWPCSPCVYCVDTFLRKSHYCPKCEEYLGKCDF